MAGMGIRSAIAEASELEAVRAIGTLLGLDDDEIARFEARANANRLRRPLVVSLPFELRSALLDYQRTGQLPPEPVTMFEHAGVVSAHARRLLGKAIVRPLEDLAGWLSKLPDLRQR